MHAHIPEYIHACVLAHMKTHTHTLMFDYSTQNL